MGTTASDAGATRTSGATAGAAAGVRPGTDGGSGTAGVRPATAVDRPEGVDLADPAFWRLPAPARAAAFAELRRLPAPARFGAGPGRGDRRGFHALVRYADVVEASRTPGVFLSGPGVTTPNPPAGSASCSATRW